MNEARYTGELLPKNIANDTRLYNISLGGDYVNVTGGYKITLDTNNVQSPQNTLNMLANKGYVFGVSLIFKIYNRGTDELVILNDTEVKSHISTLDTSTVLDSGFNGVDNFIDLSLSPVGLFKLPESDPYDYEIVSAEILVNADTDATVVDNAKHLMFGPRPEHIAVKYPRVGGELTVDFTGPHLVITHPDGRVEEITANISQAMLDMIYDNAKGLYTPLGITVPLTGGSLLGSDNLVADVVYVASDLKYYKNIGGDRVWDKTVATPDDLLFEVSWNALLEYLMDELNKITTSSLTLVDGTSIRLPMGKSYLSVDYTKGLTSQEGFEPQGMSGILHDGRNFYSGVVYQDSNNVDSYVLQGGMVSNGLTTDNNGRLHVVYNVPNSDTIGVSIKALTLKVSSLTIPSGKSNITLISGGIDHVVHVVGQNNVTRLGALCNKEINTITINSISPSGSDLFLTESYVNGVKVEDLFFVNTSNGVTNGSIRVMGSDDTLVDGNFPGIVHQIALFKNELTDFDVANLNRGTLMEIENGDRFPTPRGIMKGNVNGNVTDMITINDYDVILGSTTDSRFYYIVDNNAKVYWGKVDLGIVAGFGIREVAGNVCVNTDVALPCLLKITTKEV